MDSVREEDLKCIISRMSYEKCEGQAFLITGANGFIASYMVDTLMYLNEHYMQNGCKVIALCRNRKKAEERFREWMPNDNFVLHIQSVETALPDFLEADYVIHAASSSATSDFNSIPVEILKSNILGTYHLLEFAKRSKVDGFLFFSSGAVYGDIGNREEDIMETDFFPLDFAAVENCYAQGKRTGEVLCRAYFSQFGVPAKIARIGHTYGPGINLEDGHIYSDFVSWIIQGKDLCVYNGGAVRSYCYVSDAVEAFFKILLDGRNGEIYNVANIKETLSAYKLALRLVQDAFPERNMKVLCRKKGHVYPNATVNIDKLAALGWEPHVDAVEGFKRTVESFEIQNPNL